MNKGSKLKSGWLCILQKEKQLLSDIQNVNNINPIRAAAHRRVKEKKKKQTHAESSAHNIKINEQAVQDIDTCLTEFDCDSFDDRDTQSQSL